MVFLRYISLIFSCYPIYLKWCLMCILSEKVTPQIKWVLPLRGNTRNRSSLFTVKLIAEKQLKVLHDANALSEPAPCALSLLGPAGAARQARTSFILISAPWKVSIQLFLTIPYSSHFLIFNILTFLLSQIHPDPPRAISLPPPHSRKASCCTSHLLPDCGRLSLGFSSVGFSLFGCSLECLPSFSISSV